MDKKELLKKDEDLMIESMEAWVNAIRQQRELYDELKIACHNLLSYICDRYGNDDFKCPYLQVIAELINFKHKGEKNE